MTDDSRIANFEKMASADPDNELAHFTLGKLYFEAERFDDAKASLLRALELSPEHSLSHLFLGRAQLATGERDLALETLDRGARLAHERGELMPRDQIVELLQAEGVAPPEFAAAAAPEPVVSEGELACGRCGRPGAPLDAAPFDNELGREILTKICLSCWREWIGMSVKLINEMRLNLMMKKDSAIYDQQMIEFLGLSPRAPEPED